MAGDQSKPGGLITKAAARDLSSYQYYAMQIDSDGDIDYGDSSSSDMVIGVLQNDPDEAGAEAEIATAGTTKLRVTGSTTIAPGDKLGSDGNYRGKKVTADKAIYFAIALEDATADGDIIEALLVGPSYIGA